MKCLFITFHKVTTLYTSNSNGVAEKKKKTHMNMVNAIRFSSEAFEKVWGEALL